jgi:hypothetical protein
VTNRRFRDRKKQMLCGILFVVGSVPGQIVPEKKETKK